MIGIDAVDVERFRTVMARSKGTEHRLFTAAERGYCWSRADPVLHFAGTLAVKEAVIKAVRLGSLVAWSRRIEVQRDPSGAPRVQVRGMPEAQLDVSITHDGPVAVAVAVARRPKTRSRERDREPAAGPGLKPNDQLARYIRVSTRWCRL